MSSSDQNFGAKIFALKKNLFALADRIIGAWYGTLSYITYNL